jgi:predicted transposase YdaD
MALSQVYVEWERRIRAEGIEQGIEQGIQQGERRGKTAVILTQLRSRFSLPETLELQIQQLPIAQLDQLAIALLNLSTLAELEQWLADPR